MRFTRADKDPDENMPWNWDFSDEDVFSADPIVSAAVTQWDGTAVPDTILVGTPAVDSPIVQTHIAGGAVGVIYQLRCLAQNVNGETRAGHLLLTVRRPTANPA